ncbi:MAG: hypothetical protein ACRBN8_28340 [Nannocystales bacterium]
MSAAWVLALALAGAPRVTASAEARVDADAVADGLEARVGRAAEPWTITLEAAPTGIRFRATAPGRDLVEQTVDVPEGTAEERAIAVASAVAFAIELAPSTDEPGGAMGSGRSEVAAPWMVTLGAHAAVGVVSPGSPSGGLELGGGRWLGAERRIRVSVSLGWGHARRGELAVHAVQPAAQLDVGTVVGQRWWIGGGVRIGASTAWALDRARDRGSSLYGRIPATVEFQLAKRWFARGVVGLDLRTPALRFRGASDQLRWGRVRPVLGLAVGADLP